MSKLRLYLRGFLIGMIAEYIYRVEFGYLQVTILIALILEMIITVVKDYGNK